MGTKVTNKQLSADTTKVTNLNADLLDGMTTDSNATANTVVVRDASGDVRANSFRAISNVHQPVNTALIWNSGDASIGAVSGYKLQIKTYDALDGNAARVEINKIGITNISGKTLSAQTHNFYNETGTVAQAIKTSAVVVSTDYSQTQETGAVILPATGKVYLGNPAADDTWRIVVIGGNLVFQKRESGSWIDKGSFSA